MPDALRLALALASSTLGMSWLALAMESHWRQALGGGRPSKATAAILRALGAAALALSLGLCLAVDHGSMASLVWVMSLAAAALAVAFTLSWRPHCLARLLPAKLR